MKATGGTGEKGATHVVRPGNTDPNKTVVVLGITRSGTSMTAVVLRMLGVDMGTISEDAANHECRMIHRIVRHKLFDDERVWQRLARKAGLRGFKNPEAALVMDRIHPRLVNPHYVFVIRHPLNRALSINRRWGGDVADALQVAVNQYAKITQFVRKNSAPAMLVNYEQATLRREEFVRDLCAFLDIAPTAEKVAAAVAMIAADGEGYMRMG